MNRIEQLLKDEPLNDGEIALYFWQYDRLGHFMTKVFDAMSYADSQNLNRLHLAFPEHVQAYRDYTSLKGFWDVVQNKMNSTL